MTNPTHIYDFDKKVIINRMNGQQIAINVRTN